MNNDFVVVVHSTLLCQMIQPILIGNSSASIVNTDSSRLYLILLLAINFSLEFEFFLNRKIQMDTPFLTKYNFGNL